VKETRSQRLVLLKESLALSHQHGVMNGQEMPLKVLNELTCALLVSIIALLDARNNAAKCVRE